MGVQTIEDIEQEIEGLHERLQGSRQAVALSRAVLYGGGVLLILIGVLGGPYRTPIVMLGLLTATLGGLIWMGASSSSHDALQRKLAAAQAKQARLFDEVAARNNWSNPTMTLH